MKSPLFLILLLLPLISSSLKRHRHKHTFTMHQYVSPEKKLFIYQKLLQMQRKALTYVSPLSPSHVHRRSPFALRGLSLKHRLKKEDQNQVKLESFKEMYDMGSLAFVAKICLGNMCSKCNKPSLDSHLQKHKTTIANVCLEKQYRDGLKANEFLVLLDTGSTNVLVIGDECKASACARHNYYKAEWNKDQWMAAKPTRIGYVSGGNDGKIIYDHFSLGGLDIPDQPLFVTTATELEIMENSSWDGIVGLGYWYKSNKVPKQESSIIDSIIHENLLNRKIFSYYIPNEREAKCSFGTIIDELQSTYNFDNHHKHNDNNKTQQNNDNKNSNQIQWSLVSGIQWESQWQTLFYGITLQPSAEARRFRAHRFSLRASRTNTLQLRFLRQLRHFIAHQNKNSDPLCHKGCKLLLDTGTYLNYVPQAWFSKMFPANLFSLEPALCQDFKFYPDLVISMQDTLGKPYNLTLTGLEYMDKVGHEGRTCTPSFCPDDVETDLLTLGQVFLKNYYTIFDFDGPHKRLGFFPVDKLKKLLRK